MGHRQSNLLFKNRSGMGVVACLAGALLLVGCPPSANQPDAGPTMGSDAAPRDGALDASLEGDASDGAASGGIL